MIENNKAKVFLPLLFGIIMALGMLVGFKLQRGVEGKRSINKIFAKSNDYKLSDVIKYIDNRYVDTIDREEVFETTISTILEDLDPHSSYISNKQMKAVNENMKGKFEGVGIEFFIVKDTITVVSPITGGPSEKLGIRSGDKIVYVDDTLVAGVGIANADVIGYLRGPKGSIVKVGILRHGEDELLNFDIKRDKIPLASVEVSYMIDDDIGYIKVNRFNENTHKEFKERLTVLKDDGMRQLILDLRQNPGGILTESTKMVDELIPGKKMIVYTEGRKVPKQEYKSGTKGVFESGDVIVLIDGGSASASEIVAGAIQDWDRGKIIGKRSFGKGLVQEQKVLDDGSALRLTIARYYTPSGRCIQRSYENGAKSYHDEARKRVEDGNKEDSTAVEKAKGAGEFYTANGRIVYAEGGIMPDVYVDEDSIYSDKRIAKLLASVPQWSYDYFSNHIQNFDFDEIDDFNNAPIKKEITNSFINSFKQPAQLNEREREVVSNRIMAYLAKQQFKDVGFYKTLMLEDIQIQKAIEELQAPTYDLAGK